MPDANGTAPDRRKRSLYIAWKPECFRSLQTAHILGCDLALIFPIRSRGGLATAARYLLSAFITVARLARSRPTRLAVLNQPPPLAIIAGLYARVTGAEFILDCHSKIYDPATPALERAPYPALTRWASLNINHNEKDAAIVRHWGGRSVVLEALPEVLPVALTGHGPDSGYILCVCSFGPDEPIEIILEAARLSPDQHLLITGDFRKRSLKRADFPANVQPTGFVATQTYYDLMAKADAVLTLSDRSWIMQMAAEEGMLLGTPIITNHSPVLEAVLGDAGTFVDLEPRQLAQALQAARPRKAELGKRTIAARDRQRRKTRAKLSELALA